MESELKPPRCAMTMDPHRVSPSGGVNIFNKETKLL